MRNAISRFIQIAGIGVFLLPSRMFASGEGNVAGIVIVADTRHLSGVQAWWANLYNESHMQFALLTVLIIPLAGVILGTLADLLMRLIGIDLKSRVLREG